MSRSARPVDLPLDPAAGPEGSVPERLAAQIRALVAEGTLRPGDPLPSSRALAERLGISRGSVVGAYLQLSAEGYLTAVRGSGTVVDPVLALLPRHAASPARVVPPAPGRASSAPAAIDLRPGSSRGLLSLPSPAWRRAWRDAAASAHGTRAEPLGSRALREVLAERLRRVRAVRASAEQVAVTAGTRDGLMLVLTALQQRHGRPLTVGFESPGYPSLRRIPDVRGDRVVDVPVDGLGLDPERLPRGLDVLVVTPSHQHPLGGSLPVGRRLAILERARAEGFVVVEDEHTAEWRWEGAPLPALAGLDDPADPRTVLLGSLSSLADPGIVAGHLLAPAWLVESLVTVRGAVGTPLGAVPQAAMAAFVGSGALDRQLQGARPGHRRRLQQLRDRLGEAPGLAVQDVPGGLAAIVLADAPVGPLLERAAREGVRLESLDRYWADRAPRPGIVVGFGVPNDELDEGLRRLVTAV